MLGLGIAGAYHCIVDFFKAHVKSSLLQVGGDIPLTTARPQDRGDNFKQLVMHMDGLAGDSQLLFRLYGHQIY